MQTELEAKKQKEQMPKKIGDRIPWAKERSEEYNAQIKKNKAKYRGRYQEASRNGRIRSR